MLSAHVGVAVAASCRGEKRVGHLGEKRIDAGRQDSDSRRGLAYERERGDEECQ